VPVVDLSSTCLIFHCDSINFSDKHSKLLNVFAIGPSNGSLMGHINSSSTTSAPPVAFECLLQFCVRTMRADTVNGSVRETEKSPWTDQTLLYYKASEDGTYNVLQPPGATTSFRVDPTAATVMSQWISDHLDGYVEEIYRTTGYPNIVNHSSLLLQPIYMAMDKSDTTFPDLVDNLARTLSLGLRNPAYQPAPVQGKAFTSTTHAVVTWPWLILPAFELLGSLGFLTAVILETRRKNIVPWTNNVLAYFFHRLDERPLRGSECIGQRDMEGRARGMVMEFQRYKGGGHLVVDK
jgi:hypothetical protein